jgi:hypothetical protein
MNRFFIGLFFALLVSFASAQMVGVSVQPLGEGPLVSVEYSQPVMDNLSVTAAVAFDLFSVQVDAGFGVSYQMAEVEGGSVFGVARVWVPVYNGEEFAINFSQVYTQLGVMVVPEQTGVLVPVFEVGATSPVVGAFTQWPGFYLRVGLARVF